MARVPETWSVWCGLDIVGVLSGTERKGSK